MTRFEKFSGFIMDNAIYPLILTFITMVIPVVVFFITGVELMWLLNAGGILTCISLLWLVLFLVSFVGTRIIWWREERQCKEEDSDETAYD